MKRKLWTLLLTLGAMLALCVGAGAAEVGVSQANQLVGDGVDLNGEYKLIADITIDRSIVIKKDKSVTLDLNGYVLQYKNDRANGSVIKVESGGDLTIQDSNTGNWVHTFDKSADLWVYQSSSNTDTADISNGKVPGGVITGGTGTQVDEYLCRGGVYVAPGGALTMNGGSIVGCSVSGAINGGGGVYLGGSTNSNAGTFAMNGGSIVGCTADAGGGVFVTSGCYFTMNTGAVIRSCTAKAGGGVCYLVTSGSSGTFTLNGGTIQSCNASGHGGGGVYSNGEFIMQSGAIEGCTSAKDSNSGGALNSSQFTMSGGTVDSNVTNSGTINADDGEITGGVTNSGTITGSGGFIDGTTFSGSVTNNAEGTIQMGTFTGSVTNNGGKITGFCEFKEATLSGYLIVTFDPGNGEQAFTQSVNWVQDGEMLTEPSPAPTKAGYTFEGWYQRYQGKWDFDTDKVSYTMTLYAKWTANPPAPSYDDSEPTYAVSAPKAENGKITVSPRYAERGERVTVTVTPDEGFELDSLTVTDSRGDALELTDLGGGKYRFTMPARRVEVKASFVKTVEVSPFDDVAIDAYYYEAIKWAVKNGITDGVGDSLFAPGQPCTRAQIVTFLWRAAGSPEPKGDAAGMTDVLSGSYYEKAVAWAIENGITTGTGEGKFSPDATCTRAQAVTFLARALNAKASGKAEFSDVPTGSYFAEAVAWAAANGVTDGVDVGLFAPDNDCTRGQIVTFLYRAYNR